MALKTISVNIEEGKTIVLKELSVAAKLRLASTDMSTLTIMKEMMSPTEFSLLEEYGGKEVEERIMKAYTELLNPTTTKEGRELYEDQKKKNPNGT